MGKKIILAGTVLFLLFEVLYFTSNASIAKYSSQKEKDTPSLANSRIDAANVWVKVIAQQNNLRYLETATILKDATGALKPEYDNGDGLHLTADGYRALLEYIRTHGYK